MEELFRQSQKINTICLFRNYSNINNKKRSPFINSVVTLYPKKLKHRGYFYCEKDDKFGDEIYLYSFKSVVVNDEKLKKHFNNPFAYILCKYIQHTLVKNGDDLTLRFFYHENSRNANARYITKRQVSFGIKFNLKTGNFMTFETSRRIKNKMIFRVNNFIILKNILERFPLTNKNLNEILVKELNIFNIENKTNKISDKILDIVSFNFIKLKNIKTHDKYDSLLRNHYPTEKFLKKNDRKLVSSILDMYGLKSKFLIKKVHENDMFSFSCFLMLKNLLGDDYLKYISNLNDIVFKLTNNSTKNYVYSENYNINNLTSLITSKNEKESIIKIINNYYYFEDNIPSRTDLNIFYDLIDHYRMVKELKTYNIDFKPISSITYNNFRNEHTEMVHLYNKIKIGSTIEIVYEDITIKNIEQPIIYNDIKYYPIILKNSDEYDEESKHMHHCVSSYKNKTSSIIVSLRKECSKDRVTSEYRIKDSLCIQSRFTSNHEPPTDFIEPLKVLQKRINKNNLNPIKRLKIPIKELENTLEIEEINEPIFNDVEPEPQIIDFDFIF